MLDETYNLKSNSLMYFAGQVTGVEGYVKSISSGMVAAINAVEDYKKGIENHQNHKITFSEFNVIGAFT